MFVSQSARQQCFDPTLIIFLPLALKVRSILALTRTRGITANRPFIPIQTQPTQTAQDNFHRLLRVSGDVCIFDAQDKRAARMPSIKPVEQSCAGSADVEETGGAGRESNANFHRRVTMRCLSAQGKC